jgi:hypothetical protein
MARRQGTRYLKILRGSDEVARNRLIQYFKGEIKPTYPERQGNRPVKEEVWVDPFGLSLSDGSKLLQFMSITGEEERAAYVNSYCSKTTPAPAARVVAPGLLAPRAAIHTGRADTGTRETSKITGRGYKSYGGKTVSVPFGEGATAAEKSEDAVFKIIFSAVKANNAKNGCSFVPGSYSQT